MFLDEAMSTGTTTHARVIVEEGDDIDEVGPFVLHALWNGDGDWDEIIDQGDGVFEVICR